MGIPIEVPEKVQGLDGRQLELIDVVLHHHVETFFKTRRELNKGDESVFELNGNYVRAGIKAEILTGLKIDDLGDLPAGTVQWISHYLDTFMAEQTTIPDPE